MSGIWDWLLGHVNKNMAYILSLVFWLSFAEGFSGRKSQGSSSAAGCVQWSLTQIQPCVTVSSSVSQQIISFSDWIIARACCGCKHCASTLCISPWITHASFLMEPPVIYIPLALLKAFANWACTSNHMKTLSWWTTWDCMWSQRSRRAEAGMQLLKRIKLRKTNV